MLLAGRVLSELLDKPAANLNLQDAVYMETALHKAVRFNMFENLKVKMLKGKYRPFFKWLLCKFYLGYILNNYILCWIAT